MSDTIQQSSGLGRRAFVKLSAITSGTLAFLGTALPFKAAATDNNKTADPQLPTQSSDEKVVWSACTVNCGSRCPVKFHVRDGVIQWVSTDDTGTDTEWGKHQIRACLRGRSIRRRVYNPDRIKYPMKRVGKRGEGRFERISWDEALDTIAANLKRIRNEYGNEAIYLNYGTGTLGGTVTKSWPPASTMLARLMNSYGGYLNHYGDYSTAQIAVGHPYMFGGGWVDGNCISDVQNSKLIVFFGNNPAETRMSGGGVVYHLQEARKRNNAKLISIDPRLTDTNLVGQGDQWVPLRPGTDAALVAGIAWVMMKEDLVDLDFIKRYTVGYDEQSLPASAPEGASWVSYIMGKGADKTEKTPEWAAAITGVPAKTIIQLAREIGTTKPCSIAQGWGMQRHVNGEDACRAVSMLAVMTGNVGIAGGGTGARENGYDMPFADFPQLSNPVQTSIPMFLWTDAIWRAQEMTDKTDGIRGAERLKTPIKFIWNYASNCLINQHSQINRTLEILRDESQCEMIVVIDNHMTASARAADILLPDLTIAEQMDFAGIGSGSTGNMGYRICCSQAIEPLFECRSVYDMCADIARRLGVEQTFTEGRTQKQWLEFIYNNARNNNPELPDFATFAEQGIVKQTNPGKPFIAYEAFRNDPETNPLLTPSGKIEIYSESLAQLADSWTLKEDEFIKPLPQYVAMWEGHEAPLAKKYPLQMFGFHYKARTHSTYGNVAVLQDANRQELWINPVDAAARKIDDGDLLKVWNDRGEIRIVAKVTPRILPGVVAMGQGAWYKADKNGVDVGACMNTLTTQRPTALAKANPQHSNLVEISKA